MEGLKGAFNKPVQTGKSEKSKPSVPKPEIPLGIAKKETEFSAVLPKDAIAAKTGLEGKITLDTPAIRPSTIPGAGSGLFAQKLYPEDSLIAKYARPGQGGAQVCKSDLKGAKPFAGDCFFHPYLFAGVVPHADDARKWPEFSASMVNDGVVTPAMYQLFTKDALAFDPSQPQQFYVKIYQALKTILLTTALGTMSRKGPFNAYLDCPKELETCGGGLFALRDIKPGEEVKISYGPTFWFNAALSRLNAIGFGTESRTLNYVLTRLFNEDLPNIREALPEDQRSGANFDLFCTEFCLVTGINLSELGLAKNLIEQASVTTQCLYTLSCALIGEPQIVNCILVAVNKGDPAVYGLDYHCCVLPERKTVPLDDLCREVLTMKAAMGRLSEGERDIIVRKDGAIIPHPAWIDLACKLEAKYDFYLAPLQEAEPLVPFKPGSYWQALK